MQKLLDTQDEFQPSQKCYLDTKYIKRVFPDIRTMVVNIDVDNLDGTINSSSDFKRNLVTSGTEFIHLRIELHVKGEEPSKHCNLLVLDVDEAYRFEPLSEYHLPSGLNDLINDTLIDFLNPLGFELFEFDVHPQQTCQNKGLCVAYMIKAAVLLILYPDVDLRAEFDDQAEESIKRFSTAVEYYY